MLDVEYLQTKQHWYGSKLDHQGTAGFGPCFHLQGFHFGYICLTHSHIEKQITIEV